jgi:hypothetical protein
MRKYKPEKINWDNRDQDRLQVWKDNMEQLMEIDRESKEAGTLLYRYIQEPYADSYAYYQITKVGTRKVTIEVVTEIGDDWSIPYWGDKTSIDKQYAEDSIAWRDNLTRLMEKNASERTTKQIVDDIVAKQLAG